MARNSELMIHDAWGLCVGNAADMRDLAGRLDHFSDNIASVYADKAGGDVATWRAAMAAETWYSAEEAVEAGLADRVVTRKADDAKARFDLSIFNYPGRDAAPDPAAPSGDAPSEDVDPDDADATPPEDIDDGEFELVARSYERLAQAI